MSADYIAMIPEIPAAELAAVERAIIREILKRNGVKDPSGENSAEAIDAARRHLYEALSIPVK